MSLPLWLGFLATVLVVAFSPGPGAALSMSVEIQRRIAEVMRRRKASPSNPMPIRITVNPSVLERLRTEDEDVLVDLEQRSHGHLTFVSNAHMHVEEFLITHAETNEELYAMKNK